MDVQDLQDDRRSDLRFGEITEEIIVELKVAKAIVPEHQAQIINYLKATGIEIGLLINFGNPKLETRNSKPNDSHETSEFICELKSS